MKKVLKISIRSNEGYTAKQATERYSAMTVGELKELLDYCDDDMEIITYDQNNERGASWGIVCHDSWDDCYDIEEDEDEYDA